jgi:hypothetical protein
VLRISKSLALAAHTDPTVRDASSGSLPVGNAARGGCALAIDTVVYDRLCDENHERQKQPPRRDPPGAEGKRCDGDGGQARDQPRITQLAVPPIRLRVKTLPTLETGGIFFSRR